jgi:hypothetical protein
MIGAGVPAWMVYAVIALAAVDVVLAYLHFGLPRVPNLITGGPPPAFLLTDHEQPNDHANDPFSDDPDTNERRD